jgi:hypothetical protein
MDIDENENAECLYEDLRRTIFRHEKENHLSLASFVGVLEMLKLEILHEFQRDLIGVYEDEDDCGD